jgi:ABC transporter with metal-binding/Fe-S-binding domain ATP-binding protein
MRVASLFSGGKDSVYSVYTAKKQGHELVCLITLLSQNKESYMFHTPNIEKTKYQAESIGLPLLTHKTEGKKEEELKDLQDAIKKAIKEYKIQGIVTGALHSVYQASRIQKICDDLKIKCINPLWHRQEIEYLNELLNENFKVMVIGVFAYPLNQKWLGRIIDKDFISEVKILNEKYKIHPAGEGGEFETFVLDCPLFKKPLEIKKYKDFKEGENSFRREIEIK